ncbi:hypothetical protein GCM10027059_43280 [Myceligenerans halotolerans]
MKFEVGSAAIAGIVNYVRFGNGLGPDPLGPIEKIEFYPELVWDPCTQTFEVQWGPPFVIEDPLCGKDPLVDLSGVPIEVITVENLKASVEKVTADPEAVGPQLIAGAAFQRLAEFHNVNGRAELHELLNATADRLFAHALERVGPTEQDNG